MKQYKVIKEISSLKKGDIFNETEDGLFEMVKTSDTDNSRSIMSLAVSKELLDALADKGFLIASSLDDDKLNKLSKKIKELTDTYTKDYNDLLKDYEDGNVQPCVKVEAETVYNNLIKVLNKLNDLINE